MITISAHKERLEALPRPITMTVSVYAGNVIDDLRDGKKLIPIRENDSVISTSLFYWRSTHKLTKLIDANCERLSKTTKAYYDTKLNLTFSQTRIQQHKTRLKTYYYTFEGNCIQNFIFENYDNCRLLRLDTHHETPSRIYFTSSDKLKHLFDEKGIWRDNNRFMFYEWSVNLTFVRVYTVDPKLPQNIQQPLLSHVKRERPVSVPPIARESEKRTQTLVFSGKITDYRQILNNKPIAIIPEQYKASLKYYNDGLQLGYNFSNKGENTREYRIYYDAEEDLTFAQIRYNRVLMFEGNVCDVDTTTPSQTYDNARRAAGAFGRCPVLLSLYLRESATQTELFNYFYDDVNNVTFARLTRK